MWVFFQIDSADLKKCLSIFPLLKATQLFSLLKNDHFYFLLAFLKFFFWMIPFPKLYKLYF